MSTAQASVTAPESVGFADDLTSTMRQAPERLFVLIVFTAAAVGLGLAFLEDSNLKDTGGNPSSHLNSLPLVHSTDILFSEAPGLGLLEPLWRVCTLDGVVWTLLEGWAPRDQAASLGAGGLLAAIGSLAAAAYRVCRKPCTKCRRGVIAENLQEDAPWIKEDKLKMSFAIECRAYWDYFLLFALGVLRENLVRLRAFVWADEASMRYVHRECWTSGWVDFYLQHMYKLLLDCFSRPIASAPDSTIDVIRRVRAGGTLFGPIHDLELTDEVHRCTNLGSYNYLGFGGVDEFCTPAAKTAMLEQGFSAGGTRTEGGTSSVHRELEAEVARYLDKEDAMVLGMGFATNSTIIPALFEAKAGGHGILALSDELNHRSIVEGVRLSGATVRAFPHNDMNALEEALVQATREGQGEGRQWRKIFILVEGIYSMEGDFCRLREIVTLKNRYSAYLYLDEAHSIGAVGSTGRGVTELLGVPTSEVEIMMGTFTKSFGSAGGYVASSREVIEALRQGAPGSIFASAMSPPCAAQALAALRVISGAVGGRTGADKLARIRDNSNYFRERLEEEGFKVLGDIDSPIIPVMLHNPRKMPQISRRCLERGVAVVVVGYPAVPVLYERIRFCISAAHTQEQLAGVVDELVTIAQDVGILFGKRATEQDRAASQAQAKRYANWLRNAPLTRTRATAATDWTPEPLAPALKSGPLARKALDASVCVQSRPAADFRLFDPIGYVARPLIDAQQAAAATMDSYGFGSCGPRGFYGGTRPHLELESAIASFLGTDAAIHYSAGVATVSSVLPALVQIGDHVIVDSEAHLGIRTGLRLTRAEVTWVPHGDLAALDRALQAATQKRSGGGKRHAKQGRIFVVAEAVCQRTGRLAPLAELVDLKEAHGALLLLDESFSFGALGPHGRGLHELRGVESRRIDAIMGSLEHAVAGVGGFCAGRRDLVDHQRLAGAGYCFSASCPPSACTAATVMLNDLAGLGGADRLQRLRESTAQLRRALEDATSLANGQVELLGDPESHVQHLAWRGMVEDAEAKLFAIAEHCLASDCVGMQICAPQLCGADGAFSARLGAPRADSVTLRFVASSEHCPSAHAAVTRALQAAFDALNPMM